MKRRIPGRPRLLWFMIAAATLVGIYCGVMYFGLLSEKAEARYKPAAEQHPEKYLEHYSLLAPMIGATRADVFQALGLTEQTVEVIDSGSRFGSGLSAYCFGSEFDIELRFLHGSIPSQFNAFTYKTSFQGTESEVAVSLLRLQEQLENDLGKPYKATFDLAEWIPSRDEEDAPDLSYYGAWWDLAEVSDPAARERIEKGRFGEGEYMRYVLYLSVARPDENNIYEVSLRCSVERFS